MNKKREARGQARGPIARKSEGKDKENIVHRVSSVKQRKRGGKVHKGSINFP